jgi:septin family protein
MHRRLSSIAASFLQTPPSQRHVSPPALHPLFAGNSFAVVGSDKIVRTSDGRKVRGRVYPCCDFVKLRQMLVRTYMEELGLYTSDVLYENWRMGKLLSMGVAQDSSVFKEIKYVESLRRVCG